MGASERTGRSGITPGQARKESGRARRLRVAEILARLRAEYPQVRLALDFGSPLELLVATVLAAQCTDKKINEISPALFRRLPTAGDYATVPIEELEELVRSTGFYRNKARSVKAIGQALVAEHGGEVPGTLAELVQLPGVGRKTANVVLANAFGRAEGVVVDTHVQRLAQRLGVTAESEAEKIERDLMDLLPPQDWQVWSLLLAAHGRAVCKARKPECGRCIVNDLCPSAEV